jgi:hypothetical protein
MLMTNSELISEPVYRQLRIFAFDPSLSARFDTADIGEITIAIPWEKKLSPGPVGEYIEVVDADPASKSFYRPVDLNDPAILAQNGLAPSEADPQFHQQMVYAVAMATIGHFERALGRVALWSSRIEDGQNRTGRKEQFVRRLRIYPHALRDRNAFYSPEKKALLFGYFPPDSRDTEQPPGSLVFSCLSHDIIAHEMTHALLDGVHPRFNEPVNHDVLAFHEAFADIVALFQRFSYPGVLRDQIARTRGNLASENLLGQLAQQFGRATGRGTALRDALGRNDPKTKTWVPVSARTDALSGVHEPHARGAILVAAVFGAFMKVYRDRTADLYRIASEGTGVLRAGEIHPDLTTRLAEEARTCAETILKMAIRAIDYCPPVGISFGDYLRAVVTADHDLAPIERRDYRLAWVESFRQWGIHPPRVTGVATERYLWPTGDEVFREAEAAKASDAAIPVSARSKAEADAVSRSRANVKSLFKKQRDVSFTFEELEEGSDPETVSDILRPTALTDLDRLDVWKAAELQARLFLRWFLEGDSHRETARALGIVIPADPRRKTISREPNGTEHTVEIHSVRTASRLGRKGWSVPDIVVEITQHRRGYFDRAKQERKDVDGDFKGGDKEDFSFRTGCTLLIDPTTQEIRRVVRTPSTIDDDDELERVRHFLTEGNEPGNAFYSPRAIASAREPFALLHRHTGG